MSSENSQDMIGRNRKPRVHITYKVKVGDAFEKRELPFVVGVLADLSGKPAEPLAPLRERKFIDISRDNFDKVLKAMQPRLVFSVANKLTPEEGDLGVDLTFESINEFTPDEVVKKVPALASLVKTRRRLADLLTKVDGNERLGQMLQDILKSEDAQKELIAVLGLDGAGEAEKGEGHE